MTTVRGRPLKIAVGTGLADEDWEQSAIWVREAERLGVDSVWSNEAWGFDAATPLAFLAGMTSTIRLGTGILQAGTRSPANIAMTALSLASMSGERFSLGLGASGPQVIEGWHGVQFNSPMTRLRETVEIVRIAASGQRLSFSGKIYQIPLPGGPGKALQAGAKPRNIPIYLATLAPRSLQMTGEIADGWLASSFMPDHAGAFVEHIAVGARRAGRQLADIDLQAGGVVAFSDDVDALIPPRKPGFAFEIGAMGSPAQNFYAQAYERQGYGEVTRRVQDLWYERRREEAAQLIPDEFVLQSNLLGTPAMVKDRIRTYRDAGITTLRVQPEGKTLDERLATLGQLMELVLEVNAEP